MKYFVLNVILAKAPNGTLKPYSDFQVDLEVKTGSNNLTLLAYLFTPPQRFWGGLYSVKTIHLKRKTND